jgi:uncharacterized repeat protein (TIGR01451 family)
MAWNGELAPRAQGDGAVFVDAAGGAAFTYAGLLTWDANGKVLPTRLALAGSTLTLLVDDAGAEYPVTVDPWVQQAYLKASNTGASDLFGHSVAISGDTVVVGAYGEDSSAVGVGGNQASNSALESGAAYVFVGNGATWSQQAYLKASNTAPLDEFGYSVAISGDTVVVGAPAEDSNATGVGGDGDNDSMAQAGAAYVFVRSGTTWTQQAYLKASNTGAGDGFGWSVAICGDTVVVGADREDSNATGVDASQTDNSATDSGAAYVFVRSGSTWSQQAYLKASNTDPSDSFGWSVAASGDTVVVGAIFESSAAPGVNGNQGNDSAPGSGAAYVFVRSGSTWSQQAYLKASNPEFNDQFAGALAISGDTVISGAVGEDSNASGVGGNQGDNSASRSGAAYVFVRSGTTWAQQAYLKASNAAFEDLFGVSVAVSGDAAIVGAPWEDSSATGVGGSQADNSASTSGAAYLFQRNGTSWVQEAYLKASNTGPGDIFGWSVAISASRAVVGALGEDANAPGIGGNQADNSATESGAAYLFHLPPAADLSLTKSDGGASVDPGGTVVYTLGYWNTGATATGVTLRDSVPAGTTADLDASTPGWICVPDFSAGAVCVLDLGEVAEQTGGAATFAVTVDDPISGITQIVNSAEILDDGTTGNDPTPSNNTAADTTPINLPALVGDDFELGTLARWPIQQP